MFITSKNKILIKSHENIWNMFHSFKLAGWIETTLRSINKPDFVSIFLCAL